MIKAGINVKIVKGCKARDVGKGEAWCVAEVQQLGADYSHAVRVVLRRNGRSVVWYARHANRLSDATTRLNDGRPQHAIEIRALASGVPVPGTARSMADQ